jgi:hypothetical protein
MATEVRAIRGVCIGPDRHLAPGEVATLEPPVAKFLISIGAVSAHAPEPAAPVPAPTPAKPATKKE